MIQVRQQEQEQQREQQFRLLIIGASFAGLTLAQFLLQQQQQCRSVDDCDVTIVDALRPPTRNKIHGTVRVPMAVQHALPRLLQLWKNRNNHPNKHDAMVNLQALINNRRSKAELPEEELLWVLRHGLNVRYRHVVQDIVCITDNDNKNNDSESTSNRSLLYVKIKIRDNNNNNNTISNDKNETMLWGPYDGIVAADGALSRFRTVPYEALGRVWLVGDAQQLLPIWLDLGRQRLHRGADRAMQQALEMADILVQQRDSAKATITTTTTTRMRWHYLQSSLFKFQANPRRALWEQMLFWLAGPLMAMAVLALGVSWHNADALP